MASIDSSTEKEIFSLLQKGNTYAYELIFRRYYVSLCGFAMRFVEQPETSEEIVQDIFLKLWEKKAGLTIDTSLKSYLFKAVYNSCNNYLAHAKVRNRYVSLVRESILKHEHAADPVLDSLTYKELDQKINQAIEDLPAECRKIFKLSRLEGMKYAEIADSLHISIKTVETQVSRALQRLRTELKEFLVNT